MKSSALKTALLSMVTTALDYYDFIIYIMLTPFLAAVFFANQTPFVQYASTLAIFAAGYLARPIGGLFFSHFADRYGRKKVFLASILLMAFSTFSIGLLPSAEVWGIASPILLLSCRILQGLAQGSEMPGAITFVAEHAPPQHRALFVSITIAGAGIGSTLASGINSVLTNSMSTGFLHQDGWRIPFLLGGLLALAGFLIRKKTTEPMLFLENTDQKTLPIWHALKHHKVSLLRGIGLIFLPGSMILFALFLPSFLLLHFAYPLRLSYSILTASFLWSSLCIIVGGWLSDRFGPRRILTLLVILTLIVLMPLFGLLHHGTEAILWTFFFSFEALIGLMSGAYPSLLADFFPTSIRMTGVAMSYNLAYLMVGFIPLLALYVVNRSHTPMAASFLLIGMGIVSLLSLIHRS